VLLRTSADGTKDPHAASPKDAAAHRSTTAGSAKRRIADPRIVLPKRVNPHIEKWLDILSPIAHRPRSVKLRAASFRYAGLNPRWCDKQNAAGFTAAAQDTAFKQNRAFIIGRQR
jgi:hypothetical protein